MTKYELKTRTGFLVRDVIWLLRKPEFKTRKDAMFTLDRAEELHRLLDSRWYHKLMWWRRTGGAA